MSVWQLLKLSEQIRPRDTLACCWDVKQPTNKQTVSNMLNCAEQVQVQNIKHIDVRHPKQHVSKKIMLKHPIKQQGWVPKKLYVPIKRKSRAFRVLPLILYIVFDIVLCHYLLLYIRIVLVFLLISYIAFVTKVYHCLLYNLLCAT